jgi:thiol-disulfide isomerase/thioredoxin
MIEIVGRENLDNFIIENFTNNMVILLYFGADWCGPCKQLKKRLVEPDTINIMPKLVVGHLDVDADDNAKLVKQYKVTALPTQIYITVNDNKVIELSRIEGYDFTRLKLNYDTYFSSINLS